MGKRPLVESSDVITAHEKKISQTLEINHLKAENLNCQMSENDNFHFTLIDLIFSFLDESTKRRTANQHMLQIL